ncbi:MAG: hypothetical protein ABIJ56_20685 [Pseudomonadota bacterium]
MTGFHREIFRKVFLVVAAGLLPALAAASCSQSSTSAPEAPGVDGTINLGAGVNAAGAAFLEVRYYPSTCAAAETGFPAGCDSLPGFETMSLDAGSVLFPCGYEFGPEGAGATSQRNWFVLAWLTTAAGSQAPAQGEYYGIGQVVLNDCSLRCTLTCYCGRVRGLAVTIDRIVP